MRKKEKEKKPWLTVQTLLSIKAKTSTRVTNNLAALAILARGTQFHTACLPPPPFCFFEIEKGRTRGFQKEALLALLPRAQL